MSSHTTVLKILGLVAGPALPAEAGAECLFGPAGLDGKILKYSYLWNLKHFQYGVSTESHIWSLSTHITCYLECIICYLLCIPSTSAPSERVFSTAGHTIPKLRASLNSSNAADLIFFYDSWPIVEVYEAEKDGEKTIIFLRLHMKGSI